MYITTSVGKGYNEVIRLSTLLSSNNGGGGSINFFNYLFLILTFLNK